jgi:hypothetical protein
MGRVGGCLFRLNVKSGHSRRSLDHFVSASEHGRRHVEPQRLCSLEVDHQLELGRHVDRKIARFFAPEDAIDILRRFAHYIFVVVTVGDESPA